VKLEITEGVNQLGRKLAMVGEEAEHKTKSKMWTVVVVPAYRKYTNKITAHIFKVIISLRTTILLRRHF
jgi:hypothetical protein